MIQDTGFKIRKRGQAVLPLVIVLSVVLGLIGITLAGAGYVQSLLAGQRSFAEQARQAAQAGANDALLRIVRDKNWTTALSPPTTPCAVGEYRLDSGSAIVCISVSDSGVGVIQRTIVAGAAVRNVQRQLRVIVEVSSSGGMQVISREELTG